MEEKFPIRLANPEDVAAMARLRTITWGTVPYWEERIRNYMVGSSQTQEARPERTLFVVAQNRKIMGLIAGHLTSRFGCEGELQWIDVEPSFRGQGVSLQLFVHLATWFAEHSARRVCVDVDPKNEAARRFYARHGAIPLKPHWMVWEDITKVMPNNPK